MKALHFPPLQNIDICTKFKSIQHLQGYFINNQIKAIRSQKLVGLITWKCVHNLVQYLYEAGTKLTF